MIKENKNYNIRNIIVIVIVLAIFLRQFCPRGKGAMRSTCETPICETRPDHNTARELHSLVMFVLIIAEHGIYPKKVIICYVISF